MKKFLYLLLFLSGVATAQIGINNPTPYNVCESIPNSNVALFYLPFKNTEIFGTLNPNNYIIEYYSDSELTIQISTPYSSSSTTIYIKVIDNLDPTVFQITSLDLIVRTKPDVSLNVTQPTCNTESSVFFSGLPAGNWYLRINGSNSLQSYNTPTHTISNIPPGNYTYQILTPPNCFSEIYSVAISAPTGVPVLSSPPELRGYENPFDGIMTFDLTSQENNIIGSQTDLELTYYTNILDAQNNSNQILNPTAYQNLSNPQTIWTRVQNTNTNCYQIIDFKIRVFDSSTIVYIPDSNFKSRLLSASPSNQIAFTFLGGFGGYGTIDINSDGEIQISEALNVIALNLNSSSPDSQKISSLIGIEAFTNVSNLNCSSNLLTTLNITPLINNFLRVLDCSFNNLEDFDFNSLGQNIDILKCSGNNLSSLNINNLVNLYELHCSYNQLTELDISPFHLKTLNCSNNQITSLNFGYPEEMINLNISQNQITSLDLASFSSNLIHLRCDNNLIPDLDFSNVNPLYLSCGPLSTPIQIENCTNLRTLSLFDTEQEIINFSSLTNLTSVLFWNTNMNTIDLSSATNLTDFQVYNAQNLTYINLKCGRTWYGAVGNSYSYPIKISSCPNLTFICSDEVNISKINEVIAYYSANSQMVNINSYCSFIPGGDYNIISGNVHFDSNDNGCDENDISIPFFRLAVDVDAVTTNSSVFTNNNGVYNLYTATEGQYALIPVLENPSYFTVSPEPGIAIIEEIDNSTATLDFCITANGIHPDLEIIIAPVTPARPGFEAEYLLVYKNKGNQILSQQYGVNFFYNQNLMQLVSTSVAPSSQGPGGMQWDYVNLLPFESRSIVVTMAINPPTDPENPVNIDDELTFTAVILPQSGDEIVQDNTFVLNQTVVGSYDPNDINCLQGDIVPPSEIGNFLHYLVRFENTGTAPAENVVVKVEIDPNQFDSNSLQLLSTSHGAYARMSGNKLEFIFENIQLESGGHGNILLKMKTNQTLQVGDYVEKKANIYFDYNFPIETNEAETLFEALSVVNPILDNLIFIYPNPVKDVVNITIKDNSTIKTIELYDVQGRLLQTKLVNSVTSELNLAERANGMYFIKINTDKGSKVEKLIKE
ncbi:DUF7619 domain-containing protein [Flavobacterium lacus]|uniref:Putative secreted protein (Por secretion system target) n=1 Tax=Flavobacterium lacus TaxID=1353778 RepID=A0A328WLI2_9FLAO|nr:T9SS type A sorting domain-containing protein [Flavobacterium lacus]RAR47202.1 putative secreted protein (Por secretion system target) [Flavobacterium lacus]